MLRVARFGQSRRRRPDHESTPVSVEDEHVTLGGGEDLLPERNDEWQVQSTRHDRRRLPISPLVS